MSHVTQADGGAKHDPAGPWRHHPRHNDDHVHPRARWRRRYRPATRRRLDRLLGAGNQSDMRHSAAPAGQRNCQASFLFLKERMS